MDHIDELIGVDFLVGIDPGNNQPNGDGQPARHCPKIV